MGEMGIQPIGEGDDWIYKPHPLARLICVGTAGVLIWLLVAAALEAAHGTQCESAKCGGRLSPAVAVLIGLLLFACACWFVSLAFVFVRVLKGNLTVRKSFWRSFSIPVESVKSVTSGYGGMQILTKDGSRYSSITPQRSNAQTWTKRRGIAGEVKDRILTSSTS